MNDATVLVVDDDPSMRKALARLLKSAGLDSVTYASAEEFLSATVPDTPCCLVLDVRMQGMSGLDLQRELARLKSDVPIVFITGHGDMRTAVRAIRAGAIEFLPKPFQDAELLNAIQSALAQHAFLRRTRKHLDEIGRRLASLTAREREVLHGVVNGMLNKQIGARLGIGEKTVKVHRAKVMDKMAVVSVAELVRMVAEFERLTAVPQKHKRGQANLQKGSG